jgi:hypothetical protein
MVSSAFDRDELRELITHAESQAQQLREAQADPLRVVSWVSAHLAAVDRTIYPAAKTHLPDGQAVVSRHREIAGRLARALRLVERLHSGDVLAASLDPERLDTRIRDLLAEHRAAETDLAERLAGVLDDAERASLAASYRHALETAPTRPHLHLARGGLMFRLDALRDRMLDTMDGRAVPVPRVPRRRLIPGRWGAYLLGQQHPVDRDAG